MRLASVQEAVAAIPDGATLAVDGFTLMGVAEALYEGIEDNFRKTGHPRDLVIVHAAGQSNRKIGFEHFADSPLAKRTRTDEEKFLARNLSGYVEYQEKVRYRLIPPVW